MNTKHYRSLVIGTSFLMLLGAGTAHAQVCVDPAGGGCATTIQLGVDTALAGETITLAPATYVETVTIPAGKDGLVLSGKKAVLDNPTDVDGILVLSNDVTISGLTIRNSKTSVLVGDFGTSVSGVKLTRMKFEAPNDYAVHMYGSDSVTIEKCSFASCGSSCVRSGADPDFANNVSVVKSRFNICDSTCVNLEGDSNSIVGNRCTGGEDGACFQIRGNDAVIEKNKGSATDGLVNVTGENPRVVKNKIRYSGGDGIYVNCLGDCAAAAIVDSNSVGDSSDDNGIEVRGEAPGLRVTNNTVSNVNDDGIHVGGTGVIVQNNAVVAAGGRASDYGFYVNGQNHILMNNAAVDGASDGFKVQYATGVTLEGNFSRENFGDGFSVSDESTGITLENNTAENNLGEGFELYSADNVAPVSATYTGNTSTGNRTPFCILAFDGTATDGGGNSFTIVGAPACEVSH